MDQTQLSFKESGAHWRRDQATHSPDVERTTIRGDNTNSLTLYMAVQAAWLSGLKGALQNGGVVKWFDTFKRMGRSNPY
jgi:hypothetical protein